MSIDISKLTTEQKVVYRLAEMGIITSAGDIQRALKEFQYANYLIQPIQDDGSVHPDFDIDGDGTPDEDPDIKDIISNSPGLDNEVDIEGECDHEALTNEEIQEVFDNDNE